VERNPAFNMVTRVEAPDPRTVTVVWKSAFIEADDFYSRPIFPKHLLEKPFTENKDGFFGLPYWNLEYVGAGPYRVHEWVRDSHAVLRVFDSYVPGRPKIEEIELRFLADENAFMANILANAVDVTIGKSITLEQTLQVRDQWREGRIETAAETAMKIWPQFINTNPEVVRDVRFRKALMHAMNRQEMVDGIMAGLSQIAHTVLLPDEPELAEVESALVKYDFDLRRAAQMIEAIGYSKGPDGMYRDGAGVPLRVEISATNEDQNTKPMFAVADNWQRAGVAVEPVVIPIQRQRDREYRATFPAFTLQGGGSGVLAIKSSHGSQARLPENNYTGSNYSRYQNPEFDALIDRFLTTIPPQPRMEALRAVVNHMTDNLTMMNIYYAMSSTMISNKMVNTGRFPSWNIHEIDAKS
jgi:peptide/nickel transport system substrate-binding protein